MMAILYIAEIELNAFIHTCIVTFFRQYRPTYETPFRTVSYRVLDSSSGTEFCRKKRQL